MGETHLGVPNYVNQHQFGHGIELEASGLTGFTDEPVDAALRRSRQLRTYHAAATGAGGSPHEALQVASEIMRSNQEGMNQSGE